MTRDVTKTSGVKCKVYSEDIEVRYACVCTDRVGRRRRGHVSCVHVVAVQGVLLRGHGGVRRGPQHPGPGSALGAARLHVALGAGGVGQSRFVCGRHGEEEVV